MLFGTDTGIGEEGIIASSMLWAFREAASVKPASTKISLVTFGQQSIGNSTTQPQAALRLATGMTSLADSSGLLAASMLLE